MTIQKKAHFEVLDGLRGTAAASVLLFHVLEITSPDLARNPLRHAHLAVDFFFALSGFVLGYAYDARLVAPASGTSALSFKGFLLRRLIRLHPMLVVSMVFGLLAFIFDPFVGSETTSGAKPSTLALVFGLSLLLLPSPTLPHRFGETHSLNAPAWSLFQEYLANVAYGLFAKRLSNRALAIVCGVSATAVLITALHFGHLSVGWDWANFWTAAVRVAFPFSAGLLLYRLNIRLRSSHSYAWLSLVLVAVFMAPPMGRLTGAYEALCVIAVFPLVICFGAGTEKLAGPLGALCRFTGRLSYPLYIIHYPAIYVFAHWNWNTHPSNGVLWLVSAALCVGIIIVAWLLLEYFDEPIRDYLSRRLAEHATIEPAAILPVTGAASPNASVQNSAP